MVKLLALVATLVAATPPAAAAAPRAATPSSKAPSSKAPPARAQPAPLTDLEKEACASELDVLEKRSKFFQAQGLSTAEVGRRNELAQATLDECLAGHRVRRAAELEKLTDMKELDRRVGPEASDAVRAEAWKQIRRERLAGKPRSKLTAEEKAELAAGATAEVAETHATLDTHHARDPAFMRMVHSALACYHGVRRDRLGDQLAAEQARIKKGDGDRQKVYALQSQLKQSNDVLARSRDAARQWKAGLRKCTEEQVAILTRCLAVQFEDRPPEPACDSEEIQQYVRFIK
jgi:hypothetical protein